MKLTGDAKIYFDQWKLKSPFYKNFEVYPEAMQWGVYQDFFYELGIDVITRWKDTRFISYAAPHEKNDEFYRATEHQTRTEARKNAIENADKIYNSK